MWASSSREPPFQALAAAQLVAIVVIVVASVGISPIGVVDADTSTLVLNDEHVTSGTTLQGSVVDGAANEGNKIFVSLDSNGDGVYDNGEPQISISSDDSGSALPWSGLSTAGLAEGTYTLYATETNNVKNKDSLTGAQATVRIDDTAPSVANFQVTNPSEGQVAIQFETSEPIVSLSAVVSGAESATLSLSDFSVSGSGPYTYAATYVGGTEGNYAVTLVEATDGAGNDGASGESGTVSLQFDTTPPDLQAAETLDTDNDGTIDQIAVTYTESVDDSTVTPGNFTVSGGTVTAADTGTTAHDNQSVLTVEGLPARDTSITPEVSLVSGGASDLAGNHGPPSTSAVVAEDRAAPVVEAVTTNDTDRDGRIDRVNVTFTEGVMAASTDAADYDVGGKTYEGESIIDGEDDGDAHLVVAFAESASSDTDGTPTLYYVAGTTADAVGNRLADTTFTATVDGAPPSLSLSAGNSDDDGFDVRARLSEPGTVRYVVVPGDAAAPSTDQTAVGRDASGSAALLSGAIDVQARDTTIARSIAGLDAETAYDVYAITEDGSGNRLSSPASVDVSTTAVATSGGGGGGSSGSGGGGGVSTGTQLDTKTTADGIRIDVSNPRAGQILGAALIDVERGPIEYLQVSFEFVAPPGNFQVTIEPGQREPNDPEYEGEGVLDYFTVRASGHATGSISEVSFRMRVAEDGLPPNASHEDIRFYRFHDNEWHRLDAVRRGDVFTVTTYGLSSFAVTVSDRPLSPTPTETPTQTATTRPPETASPTPPVTSTGPRPGQSTTSPTVSPERPTTTRTPGLHGFDLPIAGISLVVALFAARRRSRRS